MTVSKWRKKGYSTETEYREACKRARGIKDAVAEKSKAKNSTGQILELMIRRSEFDDPVVTITKDQIIDRTGLNRTTVQYAIRFLEAEGTIKKINNALGGRGKAVTWRLMVPYRDQPKEEPTAETYRDKRFKQLARKHGAIKAMAILDKEEIDG